MKIIILAADYLDQGNSALNYDFYRIIRQFIRERVEISLLSLYDIKERSPYSTSKKSATSITRTFPIHHFTSITNKSWARAIALTCRASAVYYKDGFDVVQANDFAALIAGVYLKWSFKTPLIFLANEKEFTAIENIEDTKTKKGIEEVVRFCLAYVDYVIACDKRLLDVFRGSFGFSAKRIVVAGKNGRKIVEAYNRIAMKR